MNKYFVNRFGGSKLGEMRVNRCDCWMLRHSTVRYYHCTFIAVLIVELVQDFDFEKPLKASWTVVFSSLHKR